MLVAPIVFGVLNKAYTVFEESFDSSESNFLGGGTGGTF